MLADYLNENTIKLNQSVPDKYAAIEAAGELLVRDHAVTEHYIDEMKESLDALGPYMVISPGIAFAHAQPSPAVLRNCVSMITLKEPVVFGNEQNDPVKVLFALGGTGKKEHIAAMRNVSILISRDDFLEQILQKESVDEVLQYFDEVGV